VVSEERPARIRITFREGGAIKYISHLDLLRAWERILRRAGLPVAYSQGFSPHPRIVIAMPLPVGCTGEREVIDVLLEAPVPAEEVAASLCGTLPRGIEVVGVEEVPLKGPALPSLIRKTVYRIALSGVPAAEVAERVRELMARDHLEVTFRRKRVDIRALLEALSWRVEGDQVLLEATLLRDAKGRIGRPDVLLQALGLDAHGARMHRVQIEFESPAS
jgi:radical SAM-linked protein